MKRIATGFAVLAAATLISAMPVLAGEGGGLSAGENMQKDECLLVAVNCRDSVDSIQQRIDRVSKEINKGTNVYSREELKRLEFQRNDATHLLESLMGGGA